MYQELQTNTHQNAQPMPPPPLNLSKIYTFCIKGGGNGYLFRGMNKVRTIHFIDKNLARFSWGYFRQKGGEVDSLGVVGI